jgi:hypothetical protein
LSRLTLSKRENSGLFLLKFKKIMARLHATQKVIPKRFKSEDVKKKFWTPVQVLGITKLFLKV